MIELVSILESFGLPIMFLFLMIYLFLKFTDQHRTERKEFRRDSKETSDKYHESAKETTHVIRELTAVIGNINNKK
jgi:hypothetical protein